MDSTLRMLLVTWLTLLAAIGGYTTLCFFAVVHVTPSPVMIRAISIVAASEVIVLFVLRRKSVLPAAATLSIQAEDVAALARWKTGQIVTWALSLSIALYGLVLRYIGFSFPQTAPFFIAGFVLMLFYLPRRPVPTR